MRKEVTFYLHVGAARRGQLARLTEDPEVLSYHLWGFLNVSLVEDASAIFAGVAEEKGLEVWRAVVRKSLRPRSCALRTPS